MAELIAKLVELINSGGGSILYAAVPPQLNHAEMQILKRAIDTARADGTLVRRARWNSEARKTEVFLELPSVEG